MRITVIIGILLIAVGAIALTFQGFTFFTQERVVDAGPFKLDIQRPHTIFMNPIAGGVLLAAGVILLLVGRRSNVN